MKPVGLKKNKITIDTPSHIGYIGYMGNVNLDKTHANRYSTHVESLRKAKLNTTSDITDERTQGYFDALQEIEEYLERFN